jgi:hypothetical protein
LSLLLIYLFSYFPIVQFHDHTSEIIAYESASHCEKVIYYGEQNHDCDHSTHISKTAEKCYWCHHPIVSSHAIEESTYTFLGLTNSFHYYTNFVSKVIRTAQCISNKGPPIA